MATQVIDPALALPLAAPSRAKTWAVGALTALPVAFLVMDAGMKLAAVQPVREAMAQLGWPGGLARTLGAILLACVALYAYPRTAVLGAILLTGYLGGAVSTHVRLGNPLFTHVLFPVYLALMLWGGLALRDARLRALLPLRSER